MKNDIMNDPWTWNSLLKDYTFVLFCRNVDYTPVDSFSDVYFSFNFNFNKI